MLSVGYAEATFPGRNVKDIGEIVPPSDGSSVERPLHTDSYIAFLSNIHCLVKDHFLLFCSWLFPGVVGSGFAKSCRLKIRLWPGDTDRCRSIVATWVDIAPFDIHFILGARHSRFLVLKSAYFSRE